MLCSGPALMPVSCCFWPRVAAPMVKQAMERADDDIMSTFEEVLGMPLLRPQRLQAS